MNLKMIMQETKKVVGCKMIKLLILILIHKMNIYLILDHQRHQGTLHLKHQLSLASNIVIKVVISPPGLEGEERKTREETPMFKIKVALVNKIVYLYGKSGNQETSLTRDQ